MTLLLLRLGFSFLIKSCFCWWKIVWSLHELRNRIDDSAQRKHTCTGLCYYFFFLGVMTAIETERACMTSPTHESILMEMKWKSNRSKLEMLMRKGRLTDWYNLPDESRLCKKGGKTAFSYSVALAENFRLTAFYIRSVIEDQSLKSEVVQGTIRRDNMTFISVNHNSFVRLSMIINNWVYHWRYWTVP